MTRPLLLVLLFAACSPPPAERTRGTAAEKSAPVPTPATTKPAAVAAPAGSDCLPIAQIREAKPVSDERIDFIVRGGDVYANRLPASCPGLGVHRTFTYSTSLSRLCSSDIIQVIEQGGPTLGASCGLGMFVPAALAR